ncbi:MAG: serine hydrolase [Bacteroidota bacterium]
MAGKSLRAVLVGIAQSESFLDIQDPTSDYLGKGWTSLPEEKEDLITIWHQLTMTSGLNPLNFSCTDPSCLTYFRDAGTFWSYHNSPYNLLKEVLESATTQNINQLTRNWIINKIGMQSGFWLAAGNNTFFFSRARDMARFGLMVQNRGYWGETAILNDSAYYHQMINSSQSLNPSYGYLWWLNGKSSYTPPSQVTPVVGPFAPDAPEDVFLAAGSRGQYISISPAEGLLLIRQGLSADEDKAATDLHNEIWKRVTRLNCTLTSLPSVTPPSIQLFPNPTREQVQVTGIAPESAQLSLYDASGRLLRQIEGQNQLSIQGLPSGIYLIKVQDGQRHLTERLVKY